MTNWLGRHRRDWGTGRERIRWLLGSCSVKGPKKMEVITPENPGEKHSCLKSSSTHFREESIWLPEKDIPTYSHSLPQTNHKWLESHYHKLYYRVIQNLQRNLWAQVSPLWWPCRNNRLGDSFSIQIFKMQYLHLLGSQTTKKLQIKLNLPAEPSWKSRHWKMDLVMCLCQRFKKIK